MRSDQTPFPSAWWAPELPGVRPRAGTYGRYPAGNLPPLPFPLHGDFSWLAAHPRQRHPISVEKSSDNAAALAPLVQDAARRALTLPPEFFAFFGSRDLQQRIRSCTDCFLDLSP